jgi:hypothetical protein
LRVSTRAHHDKQRWIDRRPTDDLQHQRSRRSILSRRSDAHAPDGIAPFLQASARLRVLHVIVQQVGRLLAPARAHETP